MNTEDRGWKWLSNIVMASFSIACILPFLLLFISSITEENSIIANGYSFFPKKLSADAYWYLWQQSETILRAYGVTIFITVVGTAVGLIITAMLAYPLSRRDLPGRYPLAFLIFFTMLFSGGLVPTYLVYTKIFFLKNTILALIIPNLLMNGFFVILMRTFFTTSIPEPIIESAKIDGASEFRIFLSIVLPLSLPVLTTVGLFTFLAYWNDWFNGMIYISDPNLYSIQNLLNRIMSNIQFLSQVDLGVNSTLVLAHFPSTTARMAIAVVGVLPIIITYPFLQKYFVKGMTIGSVKG